MGNDGGSIPDRRDLVRSKPKAEQADKQNQIIAQWFFCALSKRPLQEPIVSCALGKLYNKDALLEYLLDKTAYGDGEDICGHIRSLKDVKTLKLTPNPAASKEDDPSSSKARYVCPLTLKEMSGTQPFVYLNPCGCVLSAAGLRALSSPADNSDPAVKDSTQACPQCGTPYDKNLDVISLNPTPEESQRMREAMIAKRLAAKSETKSKKRKAAEAAAAADAKRSRPAAPSTNPAIAATARKVVESLAAEEKKRKNGMSAAVSSLYQPKDPHRKETFTTMGTFTRYA